jgi:hypothetical protein
MKIPLHIAEKLLLLSNGESIPDSSARHPIIDDLVLEGILYRRGRIKKKLQLQDDLSLYTYLQNRYEVSNLALYIQINKQENLIRADLVSVSADSKLRAIRTFKGFLVNCYSPVQAIFNNELIVVLPKEGTFSFIYDFEKFIPSSDITVVGIENPENFRHIYKQKYLFRNINPLFVSRYPQNQSKDLIKWLQLIPNDYLHFGDFDFSGIGIYLNEFKKHLNNRANFFIPEDIDNLIKKSGSKKRYNKQTPNFALKGIKEESLVKLIASIHRHKKGLDQEIFINGV